MNEIQTVEEGLKNEVDGFKSLPFTEIISEATKLAAMEQVRILKTGKSRIQNYWSDLKSAANKLHKDLCGKESEMLTPVNFGIQLREQKLGEYKLKCEREERQQQEIAYAKQKKEAEDAKLAAAQTASECGNIERAEAILNMPTILAPLPLPTMQKEKGVMEKRPWEATIVDPIAFLKAICEGKAPIGVIEFKINEINKLVTALKLETPWPGVVAKESLKLYIR